MTFKSLAGVWGGVCGFLQILLWRDWLSGTPPNISNIEHLLDFIYWLGPWVLSPICVYKILITC